MAPKFDFSGRLQACFYVMCYFGEIFKQQSPESLPQIDLCHHFITVNNRDNWAKISLDK